MTKKTITKIKEHICLPTNHIHSFERIPLLLHVIIITIINIINVNIIIINTFLIVVTMSISVVSHNSKRVCPLVHWSVGPSVGA